MSDELGIRGAVTEKCVRELINLMGDTPTREGLLETPKRVAKMYTEIFRGYDPLQKPVITLFPNNKDGISYGGMVFDKGYFFSHCEHHIVPFFGTYYYGYIPDQNIIGLSKISRVVDYFAAKLQVQERLTKEVMDYIEDIAKPKGSALVLEARHLCKEMRGAKKINSQMITSDVRGVFMQPETRSEFMNFVQKNGHS
jgi:GTP cyclohydrolase I